MLPLHSGGDVITTLRKSAPKSWQHSVTVQAALASPISKHKGDVRVCHVRV
jgi:hypothetical protein